MSITLRVSKEGYDVKSESDLDNLIFSSEYGTLKYHASGTVEVSANGSDAEETVAHGLGYTPFFITYANSPANTSRFSMTPIVFQDVSNYTYIEGYADDTYLYFTIHTNSAVIDVDFYYKIFRNDTSL